MASQPAVRRLLPKYTIAITTPGTLHTEFIIRRGSEDAFWYVGKVDQALEFDSLQEAEEAAAEVRRQYVGSLYRVVPLPTWVGEPVEDEVASMSWWRRLLLRIGF
jgi:hypothetical protein